MAVLPVPLYLLSQIWYVHSLMLCSVAHRFPVYATESMLTIGRKLALAVLASNEQ